MPAPTTFCKCFGFTDNSQRSAQPMKYSLAIALVLLGSSSAVGDSGGRLLSLQQLCIADQGTGFNWRDGAWVHTRFVEPKYVVTKINFPDSWEEAKREENTGVYLACTLAFSSEEEYALESLKSFNACLKIQEIGDELATHFPCKEIHFKIEEGVAKWRVEFSCGNRSRAFHMRPNGHFHMSRIHGQLAPEPKDDYKDSLVIYVGKCASIAE